VISVILFLLFIIVVTFIAVVKYKKTKGKTPEIELPEKGSSEYVPLIVK